MSERFCTFPGCGLPLKTHDAKRLGLCWTHRGPQSNKEWATLEAPGTPGTESAQAVDRGEVTALASSMARHPAGKRNLAVPCFLHNYRSALECPRCIELGEYDYEMRGV